MICAQTNASGTSVAQDSATQSVLPLPDRQVLDALEAFLLEDAPREGKGQPKPAQDKVAP